MYFSSLACLHYCSDCLVTSLCSCPSQVRGKMTAKMAQNKFVLAKHKLYCFIAFTTFFSVGIIIFTIPVKRAKQTQAGFCFIIFQGLIWQTATKIITHQIPTALYYSNYTWPIHNKQKTVVKWKTLPQIAVQNLVVSYHSVISTYHIENSCKWPSNIVKWHSKVLETQVIESNHSHKNNGQWKNLWKRQRTIWSLTL